MASDTDSRIPPFLDTLVTKTLAMVVGIGEGPKPSRAATITVWERQVNATCTKVRLSYYGGSRSGLARLGVARPFLLYRQVRPSLLLQLLISACPGGWPLATPLPIAYRMIHLVWCRYSVARDALTTSRNGAFTVQPIAH